MEGHGDLQETVSLTLPEVRPWSPDSPQLYQAEVRLTTTDGQVLDGETVTFGFRTVAYDAHQGLLLNGQPLRLVEDVSTMTMVFLAQQPSTVPRNGRPS